MKKENVYAGLVRSGKSWISHKNSRGLWQKIERRCKQGSCKQLNTEMYYKITRTWAAESLSDTLDKRLCTAVKPDNCCDVNLQKSSAALNSDKSWGFEWKVKLLAKR